MATDKDAQSLDRVLRETLSGIEVTPELLSLLTEDEYAQLIEQVELLRKSQATRRYADYVEYVHRGMWKPARHLLYVCQQIDEFLAAETGRPYDILILTQPSQTGKSMTVTETLPSYVLGKNLDKRFIVACYGEVFCQKFGRANLDKVRDFGGELFGAKLAKSPCTPDTFELTNNPGKHGRFIARSISGQITGEPMDYLIIDDPIKDRSEADSVTYRERVWNAWTDTFKVRIAPGGKAIILATRWHEDDLIGRIVRMESDNIWRYINLPQEAEDNDLLGRKPGEPLAPELGKDAAWVADTKASTLATNPRTWYALHQGRPRILQGNMVKEGWFGYWFPRGTDKPQPHKVIGANGDPEWKEARVLPLEFDEIIQSWDCTFKDAKASDYVVGTVWGRYGIDYYLLDMSRAQRDVSGTMDAMRLMSDRWPQANIKLIEDKANGPAVISLLREEIAGIIPINPKGSKDSRVSAVTYQFESGHVYIPHPAVYRWANEVIDEFTSFPNGMHDDIVDSCTQAIVRLTQSATPMVKKSVQGPGGGFNPFNRNKPLVRKPTHRATVIGIRR